MKLKRQDIILVVIILIFAVCSYILINVLNNEPAAYVRISVNGTEVKKLSLDENQEYKVETENGYNIVEVNDGKVRIKKADCSNQTCVNLGTISKNGQTIICLPHKVEITIVSDEKPEVDAIVK